MALYPLVSRLPAREWCPVMSWRLIRIREINPFLLPILIPHGLFLIHLVSDISDV